jgi:aminoglycoside phosphotransferase (APT) family kinase protein
MGRLSAHAAHITDVVRRAWDQALAAPTDVEPTWIHGDLHPRNILVDRGRLSAVIDWGDVTRGDPATDLAAIWMLFPPRAHRQAVAAYGPLSPATLRRARGWAVFFGVVLIDTGLVDDPRFAAIGRRTLSRIEGWAEPPR